MRKRRENECERGEKQMRNKRESECRKVNVKVQLKLKLANYDVADKHVSHYNTY